MTTNDIKKGWRIKLSCGWFGTMFDNAKGNIRMAEVEGIFTEIGSVYAHDIVAAKSPDEGAQWQTVEHTPAQLKLRRTVGAMGF